MNLGVLLTNRELAGWSEQLPTIYGMKNVELMCKAARSHIHGNHTTVCQRDFGDTGVGTRDRVGVPAGLDEVMKETRPGLTY